MQVTDVNIDSYSPKDNGTCAECSVTLDNELKIHKIRVINGSKGLFVAFPHSNEVKFSKGQKRYVDIVHPVSKTLTENITSQVLTAYTNYK